MTGTCSFLVERAGGWPGQASRCTLALALTATAWALAQPASAQPGQVDLRAYWLEVALLLLIATALLRAWRRGVEVDRTGATARPWWGFRVGPMRLVARRGPFRALGVFSGVRVVPSDATEHYKRFRQPVYHVQLEASESLGGQITLRERMVIDDEISDVAEARSSAQRLADHLGLGLVDATRQH